MSRRYAGKTNTMWINIQAGRIRSDISSCTMNPLAHHSCCYRPLDLPSKTRCQTPVTKPPPLPFQETRMWYWYSKEICGPDSGPALHSQSLSSYASSRCKRIQSKTNAGICHSSRSGQFADPDMIDDKEQQRKWVYDKGKTTAQQHPTTIQVRP